jgi:Fe2+ or Zn2+ uptake regulation protein
MELMVLLATIRPASGAYGVQICREISEKSGREVALASVYAALERLEAKGLLASSLGDPTAERGGVGRFSGADLEIERIGDRDHLIMLAKDRMFTNYE